MKFNVACLQLTCGNDVDQNLQSILDFSEQAIHDKADFIITPENSSIFSSDSIELLSKCEKYEGNSFIKKIQTFSKEKKKWFLIGGMPIKISSSKLVNRSVLINPKGEIVTFYDKIHMFDVVLSKTEKYEESKKFLAGKDLAHAKLPWGMLGLSICYDVRFPKMYRKLAKLGCDYLSVPAAFTKTTGEKHWHSLLKARAIENFSYIFAPAQVGTHPNQRQTYGHSLIISPDGAILSEKKLGTGFIIAKIDSELPKYLRSQIPSLDLD
jgi:predicted amidohydrolase